MSYILEGLKKLEKNRQSGGAPGLFTTHGDIPPRRGKRKWWPYLAALALILILINVAGIAWWIFETKSAKTIEKAEPDPVAAKAPEARPEPVSETNQTMFREEQKPLDPPLLQRQGDISKAVEEKPASGKSSRSKATQAVPEETAEAEGTGSASTGGKVITFNQLPADMRKSLPEIKIFMHYYSPERKDRFVQINEHTLREGQSRPDGLKVLQITEHAAILSYQGYRFQMKAVEK
jgi:hypothetical protein